MKLKIKKTDGRYAGHTIFAYVVDVKAGNVGFPALNKMINLHTVRQWCWTTWGPGCEREHYLEMLRLKHYEGLNEHWCWHTDYGETKIYLRTEKDLTWFRLKWAEWL